MSNISAVVNIGKGSIPFCLNKTYLDRLITNIRLYRKNISFVDMFIGEYSEPHCDHYMPSESGIIFIDFDSDIILDSQLVSAINKITPVEIKMSLNGQIRDETIANSTSNRFRELVGVGYLKGFERWQDNGHHLDKSITTKTADELFKMIAKSSDYGQFAFETKPFKVESFDQKDFVEQTKLFKRAVELNLIPVEKHQQWQDYLETLK